MKPTVETFNCFKRAPRQANEIFLYYPLVKWLVSHIVYDWSLAADFGFMSRYKVAISKKSSQLCPVLETFCSRASLGCAICSVVNTS